MATAILRQFMAANRHKLPPSFEGLKSYITVLWADLGRTPDPDAVERLAREFIPEPQKPPENEPEITQVGKPTRRRKQ